MKFVLWYMTELIVTVTNYEDLDLQALVDLLVIHTNDYDRILSSGIFRVEEFTQCRQQLAEIHAAIKEKGKKEGDPMEYILPSFPKKFPRYRINNRRKRSP